MSYSALFTMGLLMLAAVAGSSRFVQVVSVKDHMWHSAPVRRTRFARLTHAALLLLVVFWSVSLSQAPVRNAAPAVEAAREAAGVLRPCMHVRRTPPAPRNRVC